MITRQSVSVKYFISISLIIDMNKDNSETSSKKPSQSQFSWKFQKKKKKKNYKSPNKTNQEVKQPGSCEKAGVEPPEPSENSTPGTDELITVDTVEVFSEDRLKATLQRYNERPRDDEFSLILNEFLPDDEIAALLDLNYLTTQSSLRVCSLILSTLHVASRRHCFA